MITIKNIKTLDGQSTTIHLTSKSEHSIEGEGLLLLPGLIDPHISLGYPGDESWKRAIQSVISGGITTIVDIPLEESQLEGKKALEERKVLTERLLREQGLPLKCLRYGRGDIESVEDMGQEKDIILATVLLFNPARTLLDDQTWERIFQLAAWKDFPVVINSNKSHTEPNRQSAHLLVLEKSLFFAEKQNTRLYVMNVSTQQEIDMIEEARRRSLLVYAETTPEHLFPIDGTGSDFLWEAINQGTIETIGSGFHSGRQKGATCYFQGKEYDALNPIFFLPRLLTASHERKITLEKIVRATRLNLYDVLKVERKDQDYVLVDFQEEKRLKCNYKGRGVEETLRGWPVRAIIQGDLFNLSDHF